jgi:hypothetical protein
MSILQVQEMLTASYAAFNQKKQKLQESFVNDNEHAEDFKQELLQRKRAALQIEYTSNVEDIEKRLATQEKSTAEKIGRLKFPNSTSSLEALRMVGELQLNAANSYLAKGHSRENILTSIKNALTLGRIDFAFALLDGARESVKPETTGIFSTQSLQFLQDLQDIVGAFDKDGELARLNAELESVPETLQTLEAYKQFILSENLTTSFFPIADIRKMSQEQVNANLESVNASIGFSNSLAGRIALKRNLFEKRQS